MKRKLKNIMKENSKVESFLEELINLYKKYNISISHEDSQGGFILEVDVPREYHEYNIKWIKDAAIERDLE